MNAHDPNTDGKLGKLLPLKETPDIKSSNVTVLGGSSSTLADRKEQMLREDHTVMEVAGQLVLGGCHSLTAAPGRQAGTWQAGEGLLLVASSI